MDKYIKFDTAKKTLRDFIYECNAFGMNPDLIRGITYTMEWLDRIPLEDVAPVVHGRWNYKHRHRGGVNIYEGIDELGEKRRISVDERYETDDPYCSRCGKLNDGSLLNYCPNCGAKMDGGAE